MEEATPAWARNMIQQLSEATATQNERIQRLEARLQAATPEPTASPTPETTAASSFIREANEARRPRTRLPDPPLFAGDRHDWSAWRVSIENKLAIDAAAIGGPPEQFLYVFSRLEKNAWKNVTTFVRKHRENGDPTALLQYLEMLYGDPNAAARAARRLHQLRQGEKQPFSKFLPILEREFADAGAISWPDEAKRPILLGALNQSMSTALLSRGIPHAFGDIISRLHEISTDMDMMKLRDRGSPPPRAARAPSPGYDSMDWAPTPPMPISSAAPRLQGSQYGNTTIRGSGACWEARQMGVEGGDRTAT